MLLVLAGFLGDVAERGGELVVVDMKPPRRGWKTTWSRPLPNPRERPAWSLGDLEPLVLGVVGGALLPLVECPADVSLVGEGLSDGLVPVVDRLVQERRPLESVVHGGTHVGEDLVHLLAAVEGGLLSGERRVREQRLGGREEEQLGGEHLGGFGVRVQELGELRRGDGVLAAL